MVRCLYTATCNYAKSQIHAVTNRNSYAQVHTVTAHAVTVVYNYQLLVFKVLDLPFLKCYLWHHSNSYNPVDVIADVLKRLRCGHRRGLKHVLQQLIPVARTNGRRTCDCREIALGSCFGQGIESLAGIQ